MDKKIVTRQQAIDAENELLVKELRGEATNGPGTGSHVGGGGVPWGSNLLTVWQAQNPNNIHTNKGAKHAGSLISRAFVRPLDPNGTIATARGNLASNIFRVMLG